MAIRVNELEKLADFAEKNGIDLTVVGPEAPLCDGVADVFRARNLAVFGPDKAAARLEGSKDFAKAFMLKYGIPTAKAAAFDHEEAAAAYIRQEFAAGEKGIVVKADGLAAGKGVFVADNAEEALAFCTTASTALRSAGAKVRSRSACTAKRRRSSRSATAKTIVPLVSSQDHKRVGDGDTGLNTGGMGAYSPAPVVDDDVRRQVHDEILTPVPEGRPG